MTAFVYMRIAVLMYMREPEDEVPSRVPVPIFAALAVAALVTLLGGIAPGSITRWAIAP